MYALTLSNGVPVEEGVLPCHHGKVKGSGDGTNVLVGWNWKGCDGIRMQVGGV